MRTHMMRRLALIVSLLLVVPAPTAAQSPQPEPAVTVTINGEQRTVRVDERIPLPASARGPAAAQTQVCDAGHVTICVKSAPGTHQSGAVVRILDTCDLLIEPVHTSSESSRLPDGGDFTPATPIQRSPEKTDVPMTSASAQAETAQFIRPESVDKRISAIADFIKDGSDSPDVRTCYDSLTLRRRASVFEEVAALRSLIEELQTEVACDPGSVYILQTGTSWQQLIEREFFGHTGQPLMSVVSAYQDDACDGVPSPDVEKEACDDHP